MRKDRLKGLYAISFHLYAVPGPAKPTGAIELRIESTFGGGVPDGEEDKKEVSGVWHTGNIHTLTWVGLHMCVCKTSFTCTLKMYILYSRSCFSI